MPDWLTTHRSRPWHHVGHRILRPFADPEAPYNVAFCLRCTSYVEANKEGRFEGSVYALKETCKGCGCVIRYAVYNQSYDTDLGRRATEWATTRERSG